MKVEVSEHPISSFPRRREPRPAVVEIPAYAGMTVHLRHALKYGYLNRTALRYCPITAWLKMTVWHSTMQSSKILRRPGEAMTTTLVQIPQVTRERRKFTVDEYFRMVEAGVLQPKEKVELIEGEILLMAPMGEAHFSGIMNYTHVFRRFPPELFALLIQAPLPLGENSAPEPDLALLKYREDNYAGGFPVPEEVLLVIEVSSSSLTYDREVKAHIYGRAMVPETWVLNLPGDCLERFTNPGPEGYAQHTVLRRGDKVRPVSLPDVELAVEDLLPPVAPVGE